MTSVSQPGRLGEVSSTSLPVEESPATIPRAAAAIERNALVIFALCACAALAAARLPQEIGLDSWYSLVSGRLVLHHGLPHHDTLTALTLGRVWVDQQWLAQLGLYGLWAIAGWAVALLAIVAMYTASFATLAGSARFGGASERSTALVVLPCFLVGLSNTVFRAQVPAYVLFALVLALLRADGRRPSWRVYMVLPLLVIWANVHGSVVLGAGLVALWGFVSAFGSASRRIGVGGWLPRAAVLIVAPWLCVLASPYGLGLPAYYRSVLGNRELVHASSEWAASTLRGQPFFFVLLVGGLVVAGAGRRAVNGFGFLALGITAVMGLLAVRDIVWFALTAAAVLPSALDLVWPPQPARRRARLNFLLVGASAALAVGVSLSALTHPARRFLGAYPTRAAAAVTAAARADPSAVIFANENYADWLLFEDPSLAGRIAYDTRYELLTRRQLGQIVSFRTESGLDWQAAIKPYRLLVLSPGGDFGAVRYVEGEKGAKVLYRGPDAVVLRQVAR
jgi:hypothetical protein